MFLYASVKAGPSVYVQSLIEVWARTVWLQQSINQRGQIQETTAFKLIKMSKA